MQSFIKVDLINQIESHLRIEKLEKFLIWGQPNDSTIYVNNDLFQCQ